MCWRWDIIVISFWWKQDNCSVVRARDSQARHRKRFVYLDDTLEFIQTAVNASQSAAPSYRHKEAQSVRNFWTRNKWVWKLKSWCSAGKYQVLYDQACEGKWACHILVVVDVPAPAESDTNKTYSLISMPHWLGNVRTSFTKWSRTLDRLPCQSFGPWRAPKPSPVIRTITWFCFMAPWSFDGTGSTTKTYLSPLNHFLLEPNIYFLI